MYGKSVKANSYIDKTYRMKAQLGSGGSGAVYMAWHTRLRKHVVIKIAGNCSPEEIRLHRNEVEALKNIKCVYIPQVLDFLIEGSRSFTIMEYIDGVSFDKLLKLGQQFTEEQIIRWYIQLAAALEAIHRHDIYHRDIKPANIMLTKHEDACLIDFNSAFVSGNNTGMVSRSMGYASPEQYEYFKVCRGVYTDHMKMHSVCVETALQACDCKTEPASGMEIAGSAETSGIDWKLSDIYSLGATIYHLLTKTRPPVRAEDIAKIPTNINHSKSILKIIEKSMRKNPSERFTSAKELSAVLAHVTISYSSSACEE